MKKPKYKYKCQFCDGLSFYIFYKPVWGEKVTVNNFLLLDGKKPVTGTKIQCGSCGVGLPKLFTDRVLINT